VNSNTKMTRDLLSAAKKVLVVKERGRCYCCGEPAHDLAHIQGKSNMMTCFDTSKDGNCHLLCRMCHSLDHNGILSPSYKDKFIERNGSDAFFELVSRSRQLPTFVKQFLEKANERLNDELEHIS